MATALSAVSSPRQPSLVVADFPHIRLCVHKRLQNLPFGFSSSGSRSLKLKSCGGFCGFSGKKVGFSSGRTVGFCVRAENGKGESGNVVDEAEAARGESTMPERFRYLSREVPDPPVRWPWLIALGFLLYAWRTVLWELSNWKHVLIAIAKFVGYFLKLALAFIFHFIGDPVTSLIRCIETVLYTIRSFYSSIVAYAPVPELTTVILMASVVLAIAEATVPESVNGQPYLLTVSGLVGFAAVKGYISEPLFWLLLLGMFAIARFVKKRDNVSSALPAAAILAAIGEPWIRILVIVLYTALAINQHSKNQLNGNEELQDAAPSVRRLPMPLFGAALAIGIHVAAKWAGYRHLTWMVV